MLTSLLNILAVSVNVMLYKSKYINFLRRWMLICNLKTLERTQICIEVHFTQNGIGTLFAGLKNNGVW